MRLTVRTFLFSFIPLVALVAASFWTVERAVGSAVQEALRSALRNHQVSVAQTQTRNEQQSRRYLRILGENPALKAGLRLLIDYPGSEPARLTVEDQLSEIARTADIDLLCILTVNREPLACVVRNAAEIAPLSLGRTRPPARGLFVHQGDRYQITSIRLDQAEESLALIAVGERLNFSEFQTPVVLLHHDRVLESSLRGVTAVELKRAIDLCPKNGECELRLPQSNYLSLATSFGNGYMLRSLVDLDSARRPVQASIRQLILISGAVALAAAVVLTMLSSLSIAKPISRVVAHLRESERSGKLRQFDLNLGGVKEVRELMQAFNRTAAATQAAEQNLHRAYVEFVGSLASALDARDPYTAGHSSRVALYSCQIAEAMKLHAEDIARLRIGALLHDIGKIGIPDSVLQKPGRLTAEEFRLIQEHPAIGRRILEGVNGFAAYLSVVELHHENWDGTGYPLGRRGEEVPLDARIVHVADAYDAMTSDRPYRRGMRSDVALSILGEHAGNQFDPQIVEVFIAVAERRHMNPLPVSENTATGDSLLQLAANLDAAGADPAEGRDQSPSEGVRLRTETAPR